MLTNTTGVCFANAAIQCLLQIDTFVSLLYALPPSRNEVTAVLGDMVRTCVDAAGAPVSLLDKYHRWRTQVDPDRLSMVGDFEGGGGSCLLFFLLVLDMVNEHVQPGFLRSIVDVDQFATPQAFVPCTYESFVGRVLPSMRSPFYAMHVMREQFDVRGTDAEWIHGHQNTAIIGFVATFFSGHAVYCMLVNDRWICIDNSNVSELKIDIVRIFVRYAFLILVRRRTSLAFVARAASGRLDRLPLETAPNIQYGSFSCREFYENVMPTMEGAVCNQCMGYVRSPRPDCIPEDDAFMQLQLGGLTNQLLREHRGPRTRVYVGPNISWIMHSFTQMCVVIRATQKVFHTSPIRIGIGRGDAFIAIGRKNRLFARLATLAALRTVGVFGQATILSPHHMGEPRDSDFFQPDQWRMTAEEERIVCGKQAETVRHRMLTMLVFGDVSRAVWMDLQTHCANAAVVLRIVFIPGLEYTYNMMTRHLEDIYGALCTMFVPTDVEPDIFIAHHRSSIDMMPYMQRAPPLDFYQYQPDSSSLVHVQSTDPQFKYTVIKQLIFMEDSHAYFRIRASAEIRAPARPSIITPTTEECTAMMQPCHCMWMELLTCYHASRALQSMFPARGSDEPHVIRPWVLLVDPTDDVRVVGPEALVAAFQSHREARSTGRRIEIHVVPAPDIHPFVVDRFIFTKCHQHTIFVRAGPRANRPLTPRRKVPRPSSWTWRRRCGRAWGASGCGASRTRRPSRTACSTTGCSGPSTKCTSAKTCGSASNKPWRRSSGTALSSTRPGRTWRYTCAACPCVPPPSPFPQDTVSKCVLTPDGVVWSFHPGIDEWSCFIEDSFDETIVSPDMPPHSVPLDLRDRDRWPTIIPAIAPAPPRGYIPAWSHETVYGVYFRWYHQWYTLLENRFVQVEPYWVTRYPLFIPRSAPAHLLTDVGHALARCVEPHPEKCGFFTAAIQRGFEGALLHCARPGTPCVFPPGRFVRENTGDCLTLDDGTKHDLRTDLRRWSAIPVVPPSPPSPPPSLPSRSSSAAASPPSRSSSRSSSAAASPPSSSSRSSSAAASPPSWSSRWSSPPSSSSRSSSAAASSPPSSRSSSAAASSPPSSSRSSSAAASPPSRSSRWSSPPSSSSRSSSAAASPPSSPPSSSRSSSRSSRSSSRSSSRWSPRSPRSSRSSSPPARWKRNIEGQSTQERKRRRM